jgi:hypothetical protein
MLRNERENASCRCGNPWSHVYMAVSAKEYKWVCPPLQTLQQELPLPSKLSRDSVIKSAKKSKISKDPLEVTFENLYRLSKKLDSPDADEYLYYKKHIIEKSQIKHKYNAQECTLSINLNRTHSIVKNVVFKKFATTSGGIWKKAQLVLDGQYSEMFYVNINGGKIFSVDNSFIPMYVAFTQISIDIYDVGDELDFRMELIDLNQTVKHNILHDYTSSMYNHDKAIDSILIGIKNLCGLYNLWINKFSFITLLFSDGMICIRYPNKNIMIKYRKTHDIDKHVMVFNYDPNRYEDEAVKFKMFNTFKIREEIKLEYKLANFIANNRNALYLL